MSAPVQLLSDGLWAGTDREHILKEFPLSPTSAALPSRTLPGVGTKAKQRPKRRGVSWLACFAPSPAAESPPPKVEPPRARLALTPTHLLYLVPGQQLLRLPLAELDEAQLKWIEVSGVKVSKVTITMSQPNKPATIIRGVKDPQTLLDAINERCQQLRNGAGGTLTESRSVRARMAPGNTPDAPPVNREAGASGALRPNAARSLFTDAPDPQPEALPLAPVWPGAGSNLLQLSPFARSPVQQAAVTALIATPVSGVPSNGRQSPPVTLLRDPEAESSGSDAAAVAPRPSPRLSPPRPLLNRHGGNPPPEAEDSLLGPGLASPATYGTVGASYLSGAASASVSPSPSPSREVLQRGRMPEQHQEQLPPLQQRHEVTQQPVQYCTPDPEIVPVEALDEDPSLELQLPSALSSRRASGAVSTPRLPLPQPTSSRQALTARPSEAGISFRSASSGGLRDPSPSVASAASVAASPTGSPAEITGSAAGTPGADVAQPSPSRHAQSAVAAVLQSGHEPRSAASPGRPPTTMGLMGIAAAAASMSAVLTTAASAGLSSMGLGLAAAPATAAAASAVAAPAAATAVATAAAAAAAPLTLMGVTAAAAVTLLAAAAVTHIRTGSPMRPMSSPPSPGLTEQASPTQAVVSGGRLRLPPSGSLVCTSEAQTPVGQIGLAPSSNFLAENPRAASVSPNLACESPSRTSWPWSVWSGGRATRSASASPGQTAGSTHTAVEGSTRAGRWHSSPSPLSGLGRSCEPPTEAPDSAQMSTSQPPWLQSANPEVAPVEPLPLLPSSAELSRPGSPVIASPSPVAHAPADDMHAGPAAACPEPASPPALGNAADAASNDGHGTGTDGAWGSQHALADMEDAAASHSHAEYDLSAWPAGTPRVSLETQLAPPFDAAAVMLAAAATGPEEDIMPLPVALFASMPPLDRDLGEAAAALRSPHSTGHSSSRARGRSPLLASPPSAITAATAETLALQPVYGGELRPPPAPPSAGHSSPRSHGQTDARQQETIVRQLFGSQGSGRCISPERTSVPGAAALMNGPVQQHGDTAVQPPEAQQRSPLQGTAEHTPAAPSTANRRRQLLLTESPVGVLFSVQGWAGTTSEGATQWHYAPAYSRAPRTCEFAMQTDPPRTPLVECAVQTDLAASSRASTSGGSSLARPAPSRSAISSRGASALASPRSASMGSRCSRASAGLALVESRTLRSYVYDSPAVGSVGSRRSGAGASDGHGDSQEHPRGETDWQAEDAAQRALPEQGTVTNDSTPSSGRGIDTSDMPSCAQQPGNARTPCPAGEDLPMQGAHDWYMLSPAEDWQHRRGSSFGQEAGVCMTAESGSGRGSPSRNISESPRPSDSCPVSADRSRGITARQAIRSPASPSHSPRTVSATSAASQMTSATSAGQLRHGEGSDPFCAHGDRQSNLPRYGPANDSSDERQPLLDALNHAIGLSSLPPMQEEGLVPSPFDSALEAEATAADGHMPAPHDLTPRESMPLESRTRQGSNNDAALPRELVWPCEATSGSSGRSSLRSRQPLLASPSHGAKAFHEGHGPMERRLSSRSSSISSGPSRPPSSTSSGLYSPFDSAGEAMGRPGWGHASASGAESPAASASSHGSVAGPDEIFNQSPRASNGGSSLLNSQSSAAGAADVPSTAMSRQPLLTSKWRVSTNPLPAALLLSGVLLASSAGALASPGSGSQSLSRGLHRLGAGATAGKSGSASADQGEDGNEVAEDMLWLLASAEAPSADEQEEAAEEACYQSEGAGAWAERAQADTQPWGHVTHNASSSCLASANVPEGSASGGMVASGGGSASGSVRSAASSRRSSYGSCTGGSIAAGMAPAFPPPAWPEGTTAEEHRTTLATHASWQGAAPGPELGVRAPRRRMPSAPAGAAWLPPTQAAHSAVKGALDCSQSDTHETPACSSKEPEPGLEPHNPQPRAPAAASGNASDSSVEQMQQGGSTSSGVASEGCETPGSHEGEEASEALPARMHSQLPVSPQLSEISSAAFAGDGYGTPPYGASCNGPSPFSSPVPAWHTAAHRPCAPPVTASRAATAPGLEGDGAPMESPRLPFSASAEELFLNPLFITPSKDMRASASRSPNVHDGAGTITLPLAAYALEGDPYVAGSGSPSISTSGSPGPSPHAYEPTSPASPCVGPPVWLASASVFAASAAAASRSVRGEDSRGSSSGGSRDSPPSASDLLPPYTTDGVHEELTFGGELGAEPSGGVSEADGGGGGRRRSTCSPTAGGSGGQPRKRVRTRMPDAHAAPSQAATPPPAVPAAIGSASMEQSSRRGSMQQPPHMSLMSPFMVLNPAYGSPGSGGGSPHGAIGTLLSGPSTVLAEPVGGDAESVQTYGSAGNGVQQGDVASSRAETLALPEHTDAAVDQRQPSAAAGEGVASEGRASVPPVQHETVPSAVLVPRAPLAEATPVTAQAAGRSPVYRPLPRPRPQPTRLFVGSELQGLPVGVGAAHVSRPSGDQGSAASPSPSPLGAPPPTPAASTVTGTVAVGAGQGMTASPSASSYLTPKGRRPFSQSGATSSCQGSPNSQQAAQAAALLRQANDAVDTARVAVERGDAAWLASITGTLNAVQMALDALKGFSTGSP